MTECIQMGMALYPNWIRAWAVLVVLDIALFMLLPFLVDEEEQGYESVSAVGVIDQLTEEVSRGP